MATQITTSFTDSNSNDAWQSLVDRRLLMRGVYNHFCQMFTTKKPLGARQGKTMMFRRYAAPSKQTTALTEGVTPTPISKSKTDVAATLAAYGAWMENSDFLELTLPEGTLDDVDQLSQNMGETMDLLYAIMWASDVTNIVYSSGTSEGTVTSLAVYEDYNKAIRTLRNNKAKRMTPMVSGATKVGSGSIMPGYWMICSESQFYDIRGGDTFKGRFRLPSDYSSLGSALDGEGGALDVGIRILPVPDADLNDSSDSGLVTDDTGSSSIDTNVVASTGGTSADVHYGVIIGQEAAASVSLGNDNGGIIRTALGSAQGADPLRQRSTIGWKKYDARTILNAAFMCHVATAVSA